ncbi:MAG: UDP-N-acetylmuramoyl-tripeptide--D-alanyl-D-alanine ligase [Fimbriimonadaceae bacterium]|nr:UDP-N-acetylmuramoyl-tripeptide--D-alanyl-D-alanine ligase [Chitinophagales bacterium]
MRAKELFQLFQKSTGVTIDSRSVQPGNIFFALMGEHANGNAYAEIAIEKGALCAVIDDVNYNINENFFLVDDSLTALQQLAKTYRDTLVIPFIAITGSNGKTTTKELMQAVLNKKYNAFATKGNLNNHIGVPLSILSVMRQHTIAIIEMGANHQKEIEFLCSLSNPTHALITNIGKAHLEGFGGPEGVKNGKSELYYYIMQNNGIVFANSGQEQLFDVYAKYDKVITYGFKENDFVNGKIISSLPFATIKIDDFIIESNLVGQYNAENILAAACAGKYFGIDLQEIKDAIETYIPRNNRSEWKEINDNHFILDAYNANPSSMKVAIENFMRLDVSPKIVILGDMLEMGKYAAEEHTHILDTALSGNFNAIITVGNEFEKAAAGKNIKAFKTNAAAKEYFNSQNYKGVYILLKGSRGIALEKIIE